jgi:SAM-dependent methyltransferase
MINKIDYNTGQCCLDFIKYEPSGIISLEGWSFEETVNNFGLFINEIRVDNFSIFRTLRCDVSISYQSDNKFHGFVIEYSISKSLDRSKVIVRYNDEVIYDKRVSFQITNPHYERLIDSDIVYGRDSIYGYGPPTLDIDLEIVSFLNYYVASKTIDFGCGRGNIVKYLRKGGIEAFGIEIDRKAIRDTLLEEITPYITLYDGSLPLPFGNNEFQWAIAVEVIEHIIEYEKALKELARIASHLLITVPDISAIPRCFPANIVPWHLLESTHVNFFTINSFKKCLYRYYKNVKLFKIGRVIVNECSFYNSLVAICSR